MSKTVKPTSRWVGGISDFPKEGTADTYSMGRNINHRSDPRSITLNPRTIKESGSIIEDLPKWAEIVGTNTYVYGDAGKIYARTSAGVWSKLRQAPESHGNGLSYFGEDDFLYYTTDTVIGRYGPLSSASPQFIDDYFGSLGGVPLNTNALYLAAASSQYAYRADTASLSITGDLSIEAQIHPLSLPTVGNSMTLVSKWNESGNIRSYRFGINAVSGFFGDGSDGALTISSNTTDAPIDSACSGTVGTTSLTATNVNFATGQQILIHQTRGTNAGTWQRNKIIGYTAGTITLDQPLNITYASSGNNCAQVLVLKQYTNVTVNSSRTWTVKAWNGTVGGILAFLANGTVDVQGTISANGGTNASAVGNNTSVAGGTGGGFRGGAGYGYGPSPGHGGCGEGTAGPSVRQYTSNGNGGGGGKQNSGGNSGGGGGGNGEAGKDGNGNDATPSNGLGGTTAGTADLTTLVFGGGGGGCSFSSANPSPTIVSGCSGGGIIFISGATITISGAITANGGNPIDAQYVPSDWGQGGSGGGGSILLKTQNATLGSGLISAIGGNSTPNDRANWTNCGQGGTGRVCVDYYTAYTGTSTPTLNPIQDNSLVTNTTYQLNLSVSTNGTAFDSLAKEFTPITDNWQHVAVSWDASASTATFYHNGVSLGSQTGSLTAISDNASEFFVGTHKDGAGTAVSFYDGYIDEVRVFSSVRTLDDYLQGINQQILTTTPNLAAYFKFNGDLNDATANANNLTGSGSPTYVDDVPFPSPTTRLDIDQSATTSGQTYTTPVAISESATNRKTFTPAKDPQKSIAVLVAAKGTGDWTLTVHDQYNNLITSATIANALIAVGYNEFVFSTPWRPLINASYHFHLTSTVNDGTVTTTTLNDLETVSYRTYFQFLVTDTEWHPIAKMLQFIVFGNERYIGKYEATLYDPNYITLPAGYRVRCFGYYQEYLAIGTQKGSTITQQDSGRIYFWDGIASTYNFYIDVPEGGINALLGSKGKLEIWAGYEGDYLVYQGGSGADQIKRIPKITSDKYIEIYPGAVTKWRMLTRWGIGNSDSSDIERGIYTYGAQNTRYPDSLSQDFVISTGSYGSTVKIGMLTVVNKKLLIGWQDNVSYGVDYIDLANDPYPSGTVEHIIIDDGAVWKEKEALTLVAKFKALNSGEGVDIKYKINRTDNWTNLGAVTTAGATEARLAISGGGSRYNEFQYAADLSTSTTTSPTLLEIAIERDLLETETRV